VTLQRVGVNLGQDELELIREAIPAGIFRSGQADEQEVVGVFNVFVGVAAFGIGTDEPAELGVGLLQVASISVDASANPMRKEMVLVDGERLFGSFFRVAPPAAQEMDLGEAGQQVGVGVRVFQGRFEDRLGLVQLTLTLKSLALADRGGDFLFGVFSE